jgi:hypothetical protein
VLNNQIINPATTSKQVKSETGVMLHSHLKSTLMVMPTIPLHATTSCTPQNPFGTPLHQMMKNPAIQQNPTVGQIPIRGNLPSTQNSN